MLNTSIVLYNHSVAEIESLVLSLRQSALVQEVYLIDNSPTPSPEFNSLPVNYIFNNKNLGYGAAHNIALRKTIEQGISYHLVVNPDIELNGSELEEIVKFMDINTNIGLLMPKVLYPDGKIQYLCKLLPTPFDLIYRRFLPQDWTEKRMERFEMRVSGYNKLMDVPYLSGCFMFLRTEALKEVGLFDERFFMYPEDIDLTRRIHRKYQTVFLPDVSIVHHHAQSSYLNFRMLMIHTVNMIKYFNKWGWFFDKERREVNKSIIKQFNDGFTSYSK
ncbi:MAG: glycosyltransferase family 2 protein [Paludibacter sp.]|nr:glycosyltransferase family 2 protein [Paludibacter sp.]